MNSRSTKTLSSKDERILNALGTELLSTSAQADVSRVQALLNGHAPAWFQDQTTGWGALHFAIAGDVDELGNSPGDVAISLNDQECYELIRDAGLRSEFTLHAIQSKTSLTALRAEDSTPAGSTDEFLKSKLVYRTDENGQEVVVIDIGGEEVGVMMGWEKPISE
ncbi:Arginine N-methyltransferase 2 [Rhizoctonia solani AG-1 IB]|uniref:Arginine N-methyltransferase 2 n=1 Tax=Thanatephorus cucumeris (strain AG1-IB / isolate 7/3/14) TaxID=1108050 RepID=M5C8P0_THACB|nr:Arginine N-methyltransferase 2 [Rhizoctonia solani AG-1 IB]